MRGEGGCGVCGCEWSEEVRGEGGGGSRGHVMCIESIKGEGGGGAG